jgi:Peptidase A4 family
MPSIRSGVLGALAVLPLIAQPSSGPIARLATAQIFPRLHAPMRFHRLRLDGTMESENWSGYAATGSSFTQAKGSWTVPTVNCSVTPNTYGSFWVGLDGYSSSTVEQTGTDSDCDGASPSYYAWYEFYPNPSVFISNLAISPGDHMSAEVSYSGGEFTITITNESTGHSFSKSSRVSGAQRSSAEWIAEAPCCTRRGGILPLSDFGLVSLGEDYTGVMGTNDATDASNSGPVSAFGSSVQEITMVSTTGMDEAVPSTLTSDGTSFTVTWKSE